MQRIVFNRRAFPQRENPPMEEKKQWMRTALKVTHRFVSSYLFVNGLQKSIALSMYLLICHDYKKNPDNFLVLNEDTCSSEDEISKLSALSICVLAAAFGHYNLYRYTR